VVAGLARPHFSNGFRSPVDPSFAATRPAGISDRKGAVPEVIASAISYASEDERLAASIHAGLKSRFRVFFAPDQEAYLWGEQLGLTLPKIYGENSRFVLVLSSAAYVSKHWTLSSSMRPK
jgi:MOSC domain-containing protein YiiM